MKYCPNCRTSYTDETLKFCLQDGTPLTVQQIEPLSDTPTVAFDNEQTVMSSRQVEPIRVPVQAPPPDPQPSREETLSPPAAKKSNTFLIVLTTALATLLLLGGALAAWYFMNNRKQQVAVNVNTAAPKTNRAPNINAANNAENSASNTESNAASPTPTSTPAPKPTIKPEDARTIITDVEYVIDDWEEASENLDLNRHLNNYAGTVDYYKAGKVSAARVRADKQNAFDQYDSINFNISNLKITPDESGEKATAVFDKEWTFEGEGKYSSGKVQQLLTLNKIGGKWKITGEKDLKIYYTEK